MILLYKGTNALLAFDWKSGVGAFFKIYLKNFCNP